MDSVEAKRKICIRDKGFTLLELLTTLVIAAVVLGIGVPSFAEMIRTNRLIAQTNEFIATINYIRSEAIKRGTRVTMCKSADQSSCSALDSVNWEDGWIAFVDLNADGVLDAGEDVLRKGNPLSSDNKCRPDAAYDDFISYKATGRVLGSGASNSGSFKICDPDLDGARMVNINITGRPQASYASSASCP